MAIDIKKDSIDLGIVVRDSAKALAFYRDTLGLEHIADTPMPGGGTMHRLMCGSSLIKVVSLDKTPEAAAPPGGIQGASGYRYWTITIGNLEAAAQQCADGGYRLVVPVREIRPGIRIAIVEDPDGNWVELLEST